MTSTISGFGLGLVNSSLNVLGRAQGSLGQAATGRSGEGVFVNAATGNLIIQRQDDFLAGRGLGVATVRTYNSQGKYDGDNNDRWTVGFYRHLKNLTTHWPNTGDEGCPSEITRVDGDGAETVYGWDRARRAYVGKDGAGSYDTLVYNDCDRSWTWTDGDTQVTEAYDAQGYLLSQSDPDGNTTTYAYRGNLLVEARTSSGEVTRLDYVGNILVDVTVLGADHQITTRTHYDYTQFGRLARVTVDLSPEDGSTCDGRTYVTNYTYNSLGQLAGLTQTDGTALSFSYDAAGRVSSIRDALGNRTSYSYDALHRTTTVTDPLGLQTQLSYDARGQLVRITEPAVGGASTTRQFAYNANGDVVQVTDGEGNVMSFGYDSHGNQVLQRDAAGNTVTRTYDAANRLLSETAYLTPDPDGPGAGQPGAPLTTRYVYDAAGHGRLRFILSPEGRVTEYRYDCFGQRTSAIQYSADAYAGAGASEADLAAWVAGTADRSRALRTDMAYDFRGQLASRTTYAKLDAGGAGVTDGSQSTTTFVYDAAGQLLRTVAPESSQERTTTTYDGLGRVLAQVDALGRVTTYRYDDAGNTFAQTAANGLVTVQAFDRAGRLVSLSQTDAAGHGLGTGRMYYDADGRLRMSQDPTGARTWFLYDAEGRKVAEIDSNGGLTETRYDRNGQVTGTVAYATAADLAGLTVDALGRPTSAALALDLAALRPAAAAQDQRTWAAYDAAGRLVKTVDGTGAVVEMMYDGDSRIVKVVHYANRIATAGLGGAPSAAGIAPAPSAEDRVTLHLYDKDGLLRGTVDGEGYLTEYRYNGAGKLWQTVTYATAVDPAALAQAGSGTSVGALRPAPAAADALSTTIYDTEGRAVAQVDAEGYLTEQRYDRDGREIQARRYAAPLSAGLVRSLTAATTLADLQQAYGAGYDRVQRFTYDAQGNLVLESSVLGAQELESHALDTARSFYDASGRLRMSQDAAGSRRWISYDAAGRKAAELVDGRLTEYVYNSAGQLVERISWHGAVDADALALDGQGQPTPAALATDLRSLRPYPSFQDARAWFRYDAAGHLALTLDDEGNVTERRLYDAAGRWTGTVDATGHLTENQYDAAGRVWGTLRYATAIPASVLRNVRSTTPLDSIRPAASAGDQRTWILFDAQGRVSAEIDAQGFLTEHLYDAGGSEAQARRYASPLPASVLAGLTPLTTVEQLRSAAGADYHAVQAFRYDAASQAFLGARILESLDGLETRRYYDAQGHLRMTERPDGSRSWVLYDGYGRKAADVDAGGRLTEYRYDECDRLSETIVYAGAVDARLLSVDAQGRPTEEALCLHLSDLRPRSSAQDQKLWTAYDGQGRAVKTVDGNGVVVENKYDAQGRLAQVVHYANRISTDWLGSAPAPWQINPRPSTADKVEKNVYDAAGHLAGAIGLDGRLTERRYDASGRVWETLTYATPLDPAVIASVTATTPLDGIRPAPSAGDQRSFTLYDAQGRVSAEIDAQGRLTEHTCDAQGRRVQTVRYATALSAAALDGITAATTVDALRPAPQVATYQDRQFRYDAVGRLILEADEEGTEIRYQYDAADHLIAKTVAYGTAEARTGTARYDLQGRLLEERLSVTDAAGTTYTYDAAGRRTSATDALGHRTRFIYDGEGQLLYTVNALGEVEGRSYDALGQLAAVTRYGNPLPPDLLDGLLKDGGLATPALRAILGQLTDAAADTTTRYAYDAAGRVSGVTDALGKVTRYTYDAFGEQVRVEAPFNGADTTVSTLAYDHRGLLRSTTLDAGGIGATVRSEYDAFGRLTSATDPNGDVQRWTYDRLGRTVQVTGALGGVQATAYDAYDRTVSTTDALGRTTRYAYDLAARSARVTTPEGITVTTTHNRHGQEQTVRDGNGNLTTYTYDADGLLVRTDAPLQTTTQRYDAAHRLIETTDPNGVRTVLTYDAANRVLSRTVDPSGLALTTTYAYDAKGEVLSVTDPRGVVTRFAYDAKGQLASQTVDPAGLNLVTRFAYDDMGHVLRVTGPNGTATAYAFDHLGRRTEVRLDPDGLNLTTRYAYDGDGNLVRTTDAEGRVTRYAYDAENNLAFTVDGAGDVTGYQYDLEGRLTQTVRYATPLVAADLTDGMKPADVQARLTASASDIRERQAYDRDGRLAFTVDGTGAVTRFVRDANGNVVSTTTYATRLAEGADPATVAASAQDRTTRAVYDAADRMVYGVDAGGTVTRLDYDPDGRVLRTTTYATRLAAGADPASVPASAQDRVARAFYDAAGRTTCTVDPLGAVTRFEYDADGHLTRSTAYATLLAPGADPSSVAASAQDRSQRAAYDAAGRRTWTVDAGGAVTRTTYDGNGNAVSVTAFATRLAEGADPATVAASAQDRTTRAAYDAANRLAWTVDGTGAVARFRYDGSGRLVSTTAYATRIAPDADPATVAASAQDRTTRTAYDAAGRTAYTVDGTGGVVQYRRDAFGNVVSTTCYATRIAAGADPATVAASAQDQTFRAAYDADGRLAWTVDGTGAVVRYQRNAFGEALSVTAYATRIAADADPASVAASAQDRTTRASYDANGRMAWEADATGAVTGFTYDAFGQAVARTRYATRLAAGADLASVQASAQDRTTRQAFDLDGRVTFAADAAGAVTAFTYDTFGDLTSTTAYATVPAPGADLASVPASAQDRTVRMAYDAEGRMTSVVDAAGAVSRITYNTFGEAVSRTAFATLLAAGADPASVPEAPGDRRTQSAYDAAGRLVLAMDAQGAVTKVEYDAFGQAVRATAYATLADPAADLGSVDTAALANSAQDRITRTAYDTAGRVSYTVDGMGAVTGRTYDGCGRLTATTAYATLLGADADPATVAVNAARDRRTRYAYDGAGRLTRTTYPTVGVYVAETDAALLANGATGTGARTESSRTLYEETTYDAFGDAVTHRDTAGNLSRSAYDAAGRLQYSVDAENGVTGYVRDAFGDATAVTRYAATVDAAGLANLAAWAAAHGAGSRTIATEYDAMGRQVQVTLPQVYAFDGTTAFTASPTTRFTYDAFGQVVREQVKQDGATWLSTYRTYDRRGLETATVDAGGYLTTRAYDAFGQLTRQVEYAKATTGAAVGTVPQPTADAADRSTSFTYDHSGRTLTRTLENVTYSTTGTDSVTAGLTTRIAYDAFGEATATTDVSGAVTRTYYDRAGRTTAIAGPDHAIQGNAHFISLTEFQRDAFGQVTRRIERALGASSATAAGYASAGSSAQDRSTTTSYDTWGRAVQVTDAEGHVSRLSYDAAGRLAKQWTDVTGEDGAVHRTAFAVNQYDRTGRLVRSLTPASAGGQLVDMRMTYDTFGEITARSVVGMSGSDSFEYDAAGRLWRTNAGDGVTKVLLYDLLGRQTSQITSASTDLRGVADAAAANALSGTLRTDNTYDALGRLTAQHRPNGATVHQTSDRWGNVLSVTDPRNAAWVTEYTYDARNHVLTVTQPTADVMAADGTTTSGRPVTTYRYDAAGNQVAVVDARGYANLKAYDALGNVTRETHADGGVVTHAYDAFNGEAQRTDALGHVTRYSYDRLGRLTRITRPQSVAYTYTMDGLSLTGTSQVNYTPTQTMVYDSLGHKLSDTFADGTAIHYTYDLRGNVTQQNVRGEVTTSTYDAMDRKTGQTDAAGRSMAWTYDAFGRLSYKTDMAGVHHTYTYDQAGELTHEATDQANGRDVTYTWENGQLTGMQDRLASGSYRTTLYTYDLSGQHLTEKTLIDGVTYQDQTLAYDALGRLTSVSALDGTLTYAYDAVGNRIRTTQNFSGTAETSYFAYDAMNRQVLVDGAVDGNAANDANLTSGQGRRVTYDLNGNRTSERSYDADAKAVVTATYSYDSLDRLSQSVKNGSTETYTYDKGDRLTRHSGDSVNVYDSHGRVVDQLLYSADDASKISTHNTSTYDAAGNLTKSVRAQDGLTVTYNYNYTAIGDGVQQTTIDGSRSDGGDGGRTTLTYDANGYLVSIADAHDSSNDRTFVNDAYGTILQKTQGSNQLKDLVVNGTVLGSHGQDLDPNFPDTTYVTRSGDTLSSIASAHPGDMSLSNLASKYPYLLTTWKDGSGKAMTLADVAKAVMAATALKAGQGLTLRVTQSDGSVKSVSYTTADGDTLTSIAAAHSGTDMTDLLSQTSLVAKASGWTLAQVSDNALKTTVLEAGHAILLNNSSSSTTVDDYTDYQVIDAAHPGSGPGSYRVNAGDTLRGIAQGAYGDGDLWYWIADANGLSSDADLRAGTILTVPSRSSSIHNNASTAKTYDASSKVGDTSPNLPAPSSGGNSCGKIGIIIAAVIVAVVITVVVSVATAGIGSAAAAGAGTMTAMAIMATAGAVGGAAGAALGSMASQGILVRAGIQEEMNWTDVGIAAAAGGVTGALTGAYAGYALASAAAEAAQAATAGAAATRAAAQSAQTAGTVARTVIYATGREAFFGLTNDAMTQGLKIATHEQDGFDWKSFAAAGIAGAVGGAAGGAVGAKFAWAESSAVAAGRTAEAHAAKEFAISTAEALGNTGGSAIGNTLQNDGGFDAMQFGMDATSNLAGALAGHISFGKLDPRVGRPDEVWGAPKSFEHQLSQGSKARYADLVAPAGLDGGGRLRSDYITTLRDLGDSNLSLADHPLAPNAAVPYDRVIRAAIREARGDAQTSMPTRSYIDAINRRLTTKAAEILDYNPNAEGQEFVAGLNRRFEEIQDHHANQAFQRALARVTTSPEFTAATRNMTITGQDMYNSARFRTNVWEAVRTRYVERFTRQRIDESGTAREAMTQQLQQLPIVQAMLEGRTGQRPTDPAVLNHPAVQRWLNPTIQGEVSTAQRARIDEALNHIVNLVSPDILSTLTPPTIHVHAKYGREAWDNDGVAGLLMGYRAYSNNTGIHVSSSESPSVIVHEIGHQIEDNHVVPDHWANLQQLIRGRHTGAGGSNTLKSIFWLSPVKEPRFEPRFKYEQTPVASGYAMKYYSSGSTEMFSMGMEYFSKPGNAQKLIEKDPMQAAIVLGAIRSDLPVGFNIPRIPANWR